MKKQVGIWIDTKKAVIISLKGKGHDIKIVESSIEGRERVAGEGKQFARFGVQFSNFEQRNEKHKAQEVHDYLKNVVSEIRDADEVVLFGPAEMKTELQKFIHHEIPPVPAIEKVVPADSMTENVMVAWVKDFFHNY